jgi:TatD DNase family protein
MIDTHCHLFRSEYDDLDCLLKNIKNEGIKCVINGCDMLSNNEALELSSNYDFIYSAIGFHPSEVDNVPDNYISYLEENIDSIVAIGEIGLDYYWVKDNKDKQIQLFESQLKLAEKYNKPVIVHSRDAWNDTYNILSKYKVRGVIHAFSGSVEMANMFIKLGFKLGIGGVITFKKCNLKDTLKEIDINNIVLETDSPYLSPEPVRGKKNSPLNLKYIAEFISDVKEISHIDVCNITSSTASEIFDL